MSKDKKKDRDRDKDHHKDKHRDRDRDRDRDRGRNREQDRDRERSRERERRSDGDGVPGPRVRLDSDRDRGRTEADERHHRRAEDAAAGEEDRRQRRAERKARKEALAREERELFMGHTNEANPWNDPRLTERFVWTKKEHRPAGGVAAAGGGDGGHGGCGVGTSAADKAAEDRQRRTELRAELERVKKAREQRERERDEWEREKERMEREREQLAFAENQARADAFHLEQAAQRASIRLAEGRAKPIDILSFHLLLSDKEAGKRAAHDAVRTAAAGADAAAPAAADAQVGAGAMAGAGTGSDAAADSDAQRADLLLSQLSADVLRDPVSLFKGLMVSELWALHAEVEERLALDAAHAGFWQSMHAVCIAEIAAHRRRFRERRDAADDAEDRGHAGAGTGGSGGGPYAANASPEGLAAVDAFLAATRGVAAVARDVNRMLGTKSIAELERFQEKVKRTLARAARRQRETALGFGAGARNNAEEDSADGGDGVDGDSVGDEDLVSGAEEIDVDYWTGVQAFARVAKAKATLREAQRNIMRCHAQRMDGRGPSGVTDLVALGGEAAQAKAGGQYLGLASGEGPDVAGAVAGEGLGEEEDDDDLLGPEGDLAVGAEPSLPRAADVDGAGAAAAGDQGAAVAGAAGGEEDLTAPPGRYSPPLLNEAELTERDRAQMVDPGEEQEHLEAARRRVAVQYRRATAAAASAPGLPMPVGSSAAAAGRSQVGADGAADAQVEAERRKGMEAGEAQFSYEFRLEQHEAWWHEKYRPRKPRYFNRVHTGYEWNKYNQTHYDHDNPPPKMVQGYKFNIFYPDLIDRSSVPSYQLLPDPSGATDTCIIRFSAGPPYEDIAFRVVNREWEMAHRRGYKFRFERGVLQLYFNFKRFRYRR